jgi:hypothetical protein
MIGRREEETKMIDNIENQNEPDDQPDFEPEDCDECGCEAGEFGAEDWNNGHYSCPQCGAVC